MTSKKQILFVDDEPMVLEGLRRMLRALRNEWDCAFATGGLEALDLMAQRTFDVIVTDMRMPGMNGVELLNETKKRYPRMVRVALSGQTSKESVVRSVGPIHHYLTKPCHGERLKSALSRVYGLQTILEVEELRGLVLEMESLPSLPSYYFDLLEEIESPEGSAKRVGEIIGRDLGMCAKILQLVNSAFFGLRREILDPSEAVVALGLDTIKTLVLAMHVFSVFDQSKVRTFALDNLWNHSLEVGLGARKIMAGETTDKRTIDFAALGGLLHDVGRLALADKLPGLYHQAIRRALEDKVPLVEAERQVLRATHAEVGGYLMGLWGFCDGIIEAVGFHHDPARSPTKSFSPLTAVHVADALLQDRDTLGGRETTPLWNQSYLDGTGISSHIETWRELCNTSQDRGSLP